MRDDMSIQVASGGMFSLGSPSPEMVRISDIAHGLSHLCRYNGQCPRFYSVAQHSVLVSVLVGVLEQHPDDRTHRRHALAGLLHDAAEAYAGDLVWPLKNSGLLEEYNTIERRIQRAVEEAFGLPSWALSSSLIRESDIRVLLAETRDFFGDPDWARERVGKMNPFPVYKIDPWGPEKAKTEFMNRYRWCRAL